MKERFSSINSPVTYINEKRYHFIERAISEADIVLLLPAEFIELPPVIAKRKYPAEDRPQVILSSHDITVNFAFKVLQTAISEEDLPVARDAAFDALKKLHPQNTYLETGETGFGEKRERKCFWFEYMGPTLDSSVYSLNAFMMNDNNPLYFLFNCPQEGYENWRPIVFEVIGTIKSKPLFWRGEERV